MSGDLEEANAVLFRQFLEWKAKAESATTSTLSTTEDVAAKGETPASNVISKHDIGDSPSPSSVSSPEEHIVPTEPSSECVKSAAATKQVSKDPPTGSGSSEAVSSHDGSRFAAAEYLGKDKKSPEATRKFRVSLSAMW